MARFLEFVDYRNFVQSLWPDMNVGQAIRTKLWQLSTCRTTVNFINGKPLTVEYNCDPWRRKEERVLVNIDSLLPVFGNVRPPRMDKFTSVWKLTNFVRMHVHLNMCTESRYASCSCYLDALDPRHHGAASTFAKPSVDDCEFRHFHHYCWQHVSHWLMFFFNTTLMPPEDNKFFDEHTTRGYLNFLSKIINFRAIDNQ